MVTRLNQTSVEPEGDSKAHGSQTFEQANLEYDSGRFSKALDLFDAAIASGLANEVVFNNKGASLDALGRNEEAVECYKKATYINDKYELAWHNLGNSLFIQEHFWGAARAYTKATHLRSDRKENWSGLAASYTKLGRKRNAKKAIERLSRFVSEDSSTVLLQSDLYLDGGFSDLAVEKCNEYISLKPESVEGYARLGTVEHERGEYDKAIDSFESALKIVPLTKEVWNNLGYTSFCAGYLQKALDCLDKAISIDASYKQAWYNKGYAHHGADMLENAVTCYLKAIAVDPWDKVLWNNLGNALYNLGRYRESIPKFVEAIRVDPDYEIAWNNIGNALEKMGANQEAIPFHDRSLEISPDFDYALYAKGVCRSRLGDPEGGHDLILESLDLNPTYDEAWKAMAKVAIQLGRWDEALMSIEEALAINPDFDEGWADRGDILLALGDTEAAQASYEMALQCLDAVRTDTVSGLAALVRRGDVLMRLGRFEEALANTETVAVTGRMNHSSIPRVFEVRRFLGSWELSESMKNVADSSGDTVIKIAYAQFLLDAGRPDDASKVVASVDPAGIEGPTISLLKARILAKQGDTEGAIKLASSVHLDGPRYSIERFRGELLESKGDFKGAADAYDRSLKSGASDIGTAIALARTRLKSGEARLAIRAADLSIGIDFREWEPYKIKSDAYTALGESEKARRELARAKTMLARAGVIGLVSVAGEKLE